MKSLGARLLTAMLAGCAAAVAAAAAPDVPSAAERRATVRFVASLQNADGGYRGTPAPGPSQLGNVVAALRAARYFGGESPENTSAGRAALRFVLSCADATSGGFADTPGGRPDVRSTAMGVMALVELKPPRNVLEERLRAATGYLERSAKTLPEIYIATAALHSAGVRPAVAPQWIAAYEASLGPDGRAAAGGMETARAVNTLLRLGAEVRSRSAVARELKALQRADGGFAPNADAPSDLATTYPVMRALAMLREAPDLPALRRFIARCRNADGGYGIRPGEPSAAGPTYYAGIVLHWTEELAR